MVLRFRPQRSTAPNYLGRGEQRRLLALVLGLGLFVMLIGEAAKPQTWAWLWTLSQPAAGQPAVAVDTRAPVAPLTGNEPDPIVQAPAPVKVAPADPAKKYFPGVKPEWLATIRDDMVSRSAEHEAFFSILKLLKEADPQEIAAQSRGEVNFIQLFKQPDVYRGEAVTFRGTVRGVASKTALKNAFGIENYHQVWIKPPDRKDPLVAYCLELPAGFPTNTDEVSEPIELTGVFFKRWAYSARDNTAYTTPLILAKSFKWTPVPKPPAEAPLDPFSTTLTIGGVLLIGVVLAVVVTRRRRNPGPTRFTVGGRAKGPLYEKLREMEVAPEVQDALRKLSSDDRHNNSG